MDPGTAIGLAGSALKLLIAAIDFVEDAKKVYEKGGTDVNRDLSTVAKSIQKASDDLEAQLSSKDGRDEGIEETPEDQVGVLFWQAEAPETYILFLLIGPQGNKNSCRKSIGDRKGARRGLGKGTGTREIQVQSFQSSGARVMVCRRYQAD
jgi:hypothetical protein